MFTPDVFLGGKVAQYCGDSLAVLRTLPSESVDCCVTSPPYWGLRDYGTALWVGGDPACDHRSPTMRHGRNEARAKLKGSAATNSAQNILAHHSGCGLCGAVKVDQQLGLERSLGEHLAVMVELFEEIRRILKPSGTLWLNYGDCFATAPNGRSAAATKALGGDDRTLRDKPFSTIGPIYPPEPGKPFPPGVGRRGGGNNPTSGNLKPGDLCMVPNRLAIALQDAGWWVKAENIWGKDNPMPDSSGTSRPSTAHEKVWLLAKSDRCQYYRARDNGEISDAPDLSERVPMITTGELGPRWLRLPFYYNAAASRRDLAPSSLARFDQDIDSQTGSARAVGKVNGKMKAVGGPRRGSAKHYEGQPRQHTRPGDDERGHIAPHRHLDDLPRSEQSGTGRLLRNFEPAPLSVWSMSTNSFSEAHFATFPPELAERCIVAGCPPGGVVLDPFGGSGTVGLVAAARGRTAILIDLNPEYCKLSRSRIEAAFMGKEEGVRHMTAKLGRTAADPGPLFAACASPRNEP